MTDHPTSRRRAPAGTRTRKRLGRTVGTIVTATGVLSTGITCAALESPYDGGVAAIDLGLAIAFGLMVLTALIGAIWASVVLLRQLVLRVPRRRRMRRWAAAVGWSWVAKGKNIPAEHISTMRYCQPVEPQNEDKRAKYSELLTGDYADRPCLAFHFERGSSYHLEVEQIVARRLPGLLPPLSIIDRSEDDLFTGQRVRFESASFNHHWRVHSDDARYSSAFTHPRLMELLNRAHPSVSEIHVRGMYLVAHAPTDLTPEILEAHLQVLAAVADSIPDWVWREYGGQGMVRTVRG